MSARDERSVPEVEAIAGDLDSVIHLMRGLVPVRAIGMISYAQATIRTQAAALAEKDGEIERLRNLTDQLQQQAEGWAQEARTQKSSLHDAYQAVTGATGEPGDWNGAEPIKRAFTQQAEKIEALRKALEPFADACIHLHPSQPDDGLTLDGFEAGDFRRARAALSDGEGK